MKQIYFVKLNEDERNKLKRIICSKKNSHQVKLRAKILLCLDENVKSFKTSAETEAHCKVTLDHVYRVRKEFCTKGFDKTIYRKKREEPPVPAKVTGEVEAHIIATACSAVPEGRKAWTLKMIADKIVLDGVIDSISDVTVMKTLKKRNFHRI